MRCSDLAAGLALTPTFLHVCCGVVPGGGRRLGGAGRCVAAGQLHACIADAAAATAATSAATRALPAAVAALPAPVASLATAAAVLPAATAALALSVVVLQPSSAWLCGGRPSAGAIVA